METLRSTRSRTHLSFAQVVISLAGVMHLAASVLLLLAPYSFFMLIAHFPPYNRHDAGDLGAFQLALGLGLLLAAREPFRYRVVVLMAAVANLLHTLNHIYEGLTMPTTLVYWLADVGPLALAATDPLVTLPLTCVTVMVLYLDRGRLSAHVAQQAVALPPP